MSKKINKLILLFILFLGLIPNLINSMASEITESFNVNYEINNNETKTTINFILNDNTSFKEDNVFNIVDIKDIDTNTSLSSLTYNVDKRDEYHFLIRYINQNKNDIEETKEININNKENSSNKVIMQKEKSNKTGSIPNFDYSTYTFNSDDARNNYLENNFEHYTSIDGEYEIISNYKKPDGLTEFVIPNKYQGRKIKIEEAEINDSWSYDSIFNKDGIPNKYSKIIFENGNNVVLAPQNSRCLFSFYGLNSSLNTIININKLDTTQVIDMSYMFYQYGGTTSLDLRTFDTSRVTNMESMFSAAWKLKKLDVSSFDTSQVTNMESMFANLESLTSLDLSNFDTSQVTNMFNMFYWCKNLIELNVSNFDTSNVTDMYSIFSGCSKLTSLDVSNFDTSKVTNMVGMFSDCSNLVSLDVSAFDTSQVTSMSSMFRGCSRLASLDVSNFNTDNLLHAGNMFENCKNLRKLDLSMLNMSKCIYIDGMFAGCENIYIDLMGFNPNINGFGPWDSGNPFSMFLNNSEVYSKNIIVKTDSVYILNMNNLTEEIGSLNLTFNGENNYYKKIIYSEEEFNQINNKENLINYSKQIDPNVNWITEDDYTAIENIPNNVVEFTINSGINGKNFIPNQNKIYSISFDGNGNTSGNMNQQEVLEGTNKLNKNTFTRDGYTFAGWSTQPTGSVEYADEAEINITNSLTLYAIWEANTYSVVFNKNQGNGSTEVNGNMSNQQFTYDQEQNLTQNAYTRDGYTFMGWSTSENGNVEYQNNQSVNNLTNVNQGTVNLYAVWSANTYQVIFDANTGENEMSNQTFTFDQEQALSKNLFTKEGYTFTGWSKQNTGSKEYNDQESVKNLVTSGTITLYAIWEANTYTIVFDGNKGNGSSEIEGIVSEQIFTYDQEQTLTAKTYTRKGYSFNNWNTQANGEGQSYNPGDSILNITAEANKTITLYAQWIPNQYTITYKANGGVGNDIVKSINYDENVIIENNSFTKDNYMFVSWNTKLDGTGISYNEGDSITNLVESGNIDLYAQ